MKSVVTLVTCSLSISDAVKERTPTQNGGCSELHPGDGGALAYVDTRCQIADGNAYVSVEV